MAGGAELEELAHELERSGGKEDSLGAELVEEIRSLPH